MPSVFVAGFEKAGTTDMVANLIKHPMIEGGNGKEQHFWAQSPGTYRREASVVKKNKQIKHDVETTSIRK